MKKKAPIFVSIDTTDLVKAKKLASSLQGLVAGIKLGKEFFTQNGPAGVLSISKSGLPIFLDLKFHDIPNTVVGAINAATKLKPAMLNIHATGGKSMMKAAAKAIANKSNRPLLLGVTILTSLEQMDTNEVGFHGSVSNLVVKLAVLAKECGLDGVVCSPHEIKKIRKSCGSEFKLVTPGIRLNSSKNDDQKRVRSPSQAISDGADYLVIGRPITSAKNPQKAAEEIASSIIS